MITKKTKVVGFVSILFFAASLLLLLGMGRYIQVKGDQLIHQTKEIANHEARVQTYNELEQLVVSTKDDRGALVSYLLTENKTIDFLATIEKIAVEQGVELVTDSLKVIENDGLFDTLIISFSVAGSKERVYALLRIFETLPYHAFVSNVSFADDTEKNVSAVSGSVELTISLLDYD